MEIPIIVARKGAAWGGTFIGENDEFVIYNSRMLCEGSPLLFYTAWGPVTPPGMYQGAGRLNQCPVGGPAGPVGPVGVTYSSSPFKSRQGRFHHCGP